MFSKWNGKAGFLKGKPWFVPLRKHSASFPELAVIGFLFYIKKINYINTRFNLKAISFGSNRAYSSSVIADSTTASVNPASSETR